METHRQALRFSGVGVLLVLVVATIATATTTRSPRAALPAPAPWEPELPNVEAPASQFGIASWYGEWHHGRETATGEAFDMWAMTAAHPTLPMGSRVEVTNIGNGRRVRVRVNDRGPVVGGRVLDLSRGAAEKLGAIGAGLVRVRILVD
jgi:rare lipoprotein A (peptidoglycan hydrolase)